MMSEPGAILGKPSGQSAPPGYLPGGEFHPSQSAYQYGGGDLPPPYYSTGPVPPPQGWSTAGFPPPPPNYGTTPTYGSTNVILSEPVMFPATQVIIVGGCPACRVGVLEDNFSCLGVLCAIMFFPLGILCCLALRDKRCTNCGAIF
ncbi:brain protein I3 [Folsomia candida]|uniref:brain protein I3 n=1 Tax=Folsomia candida TaxID=158441 RepID=UPI000B8F66F7|nr:brain protein I3 [Folsomia candida]